MRSQGSSCAWALAFVLVTCSVAPLPAEASSSVAKAREALHAWDIGGAQCAIKKLQARAPGDAITLLLAGHLDLLTGRYEPATKRLTASVEKTPTAYRSASA